MAIFFEDSRQEIGIDWLDITLKFDNPGGSKAKQLYKGPWDDVRARLIELLETTLGVKNPMETEKNTGKGYNHILEYDNGLELQYHDELSYMGIAISFNGDTLRRYRQQGYTDRDIIQVLEWAYEDQPNDQLQERVEWHRHGTRVDLAIDYYNTGLDVDTLATKTTRTKTVEVWFQQYDQETQEYRERISLAEPYAMMNDGVFQTLYVGRPGGTFQARIYNKYLEQTSKGAWIPEDVHAWTRAELVLKGDWTESFIRSGMETENDDAFGRLIYAYFLRKVMFKYAKTGREHDLTKDMKKQAKGAKMVQYSKAKPDDFLRAKFEHMMGGSGLIGFLQILKGLEAEGHPGLREQFWELARTASEERDMPKDIAIRMASILALASHEDYRLPFGNR